MGNRNKVASVPTVGALVPLFGSNRLLAHRAGELLTGCSWCGIPFAGGFCEVPHITARTIVCNDKHRWIMNLAAVVASPILGPKLYRRLRRIPFHPDFLDTAQQRMRLAEGGQSDFVDDQLQLAEDYFVTAWLGLSGKAGTKTEFSGQLALRWTASGGDSAKRYANAVKGLVQWRRIIGNGRCTFSVMDASEFLERCEDNATCGLYSDPPFFGPGVAYKHNCGDTEAEQVAWHTRLRDSLTRFKRTRVVCRFYDVSLIRELYPEDVWTWSRLIGRKRSNDDAPEVLLVRNFDGKTGRAAN